MKFSILIASYNNGQYFKDCYDSIIGQTYQNWEAVIVDDGSSDDSVSIIKNLTETDPRFHLFTNERNSGCGFTKSQCAALATGTVCGFLDPDDALTPDALQLMVDKHKESPEAALVHSYFYYCDENLQIKSTFENARSVVADKEFANLNGQVTAFSSFKKAAYEKTEGIDTQLKTSVDHDMYLKLSEVGPFEFLDKPLYLYRIHKEGISSGSPYKAFYSHLKVLAAAEKRRGVTFDNQVSARIESMIRNNFNPANLDNPKYLIGKTFKLFRKHPLQFLKKLF